MVAIGRFAFTRRELYRIGMFMAAAWVSFYLTKAASNPIDTSLLQTYIA